MDNYYIIVDSVGTSLYMCKLWATSWITCIQFQIYFIIEHNLPQPHPAQTVYLCVTWNVFLVEYECKILGLDFSVIAKNAEICDVEVFGVCIVITVL
jgi:hypothetical protein